MDRFHIIKAAVAIPALFCVTSTFAQQPAGPDKIKLVSGQEMGGRIERVSNGQVVFNIGAGSTQFPLANVAAVQMAAPPALAQAQALFEARKYDQALTTLNPLVQSFKGLPVDWMERAMAMMIDVYVELNKPDRAALEYADFQKFYPNARASERLNVMKAKIAVANKKADEARTTVEPIVKAALEKKEVTKQEGATYGQAFLVMGQVYEAEKKFPEALESYLRTVTIFYQDPTATAAAQAKADSLRSKMKDLVVP